MSATHPTRAFLIACWGIFTFSLMDVMMKALSIAMGAYAALFWRSVIGVVLLGVIFLARRDPMPAWGAMRLHIARGGLAGASVLLFFWGLVRVPLAYGTALTFCAPLIAQGLAAVFLGERMGRWAMIGSPLAVLGVGIIAWGQPHEGVTAASLAGSAAILVASLFYAVSLILLRKQAQAAGPLEVTLFTTLTLAVAMLPAAPWLVVWPVGSQWLLELAAATLVSASAFALAWAYARAEAQLLSMVEYTAFVWAAILGYIVFGERVTAATLGGTLLIILGCLAAVRGARVPVPQTEAAL